MTLEGRHEIRHAALGGCLKAVGRRVLVQPLKPIGTTAQAQPTAAGGTAQVAAEEEEGGGGEDGEDDDGEEEQSAIGYGMRGWEGGGGHEGDRVLRERGVGG